MAVTAAGTLHVWALSSPLEVAHGCHHLSIVELFLIAAKVEINSDINAFSFSCQNIYFITPVMFKPGSNIPSFDTNEPPCCPLLGCFMDSDICAKRCNE
eukprot:1625157-Ditylum_brightwellii.AAC.1